MEKFKNITISLLNGNPLGVKFISFSNRKISGISFSRKDFSLIKNFSFKKDEVELNKAGVYFLIGEDENYEEVVYIGKTSNLSERINQYIKDSDKDFFTKIVVFTTSDNSFDEADINFLEKELIKIATEVNRCKIKNGNSGNKNLINKFKISDIIEYIEDLKILLSTLGYNFLQEKITKEDKKEKYFCRASGVNGFGYYTEEGFLVLKGSLGIFEVKSHYPGILKLRNKLFLEKIIKQDNNSIEFIQDYIFNTPSAASGIILGYSSNGKMYWKTKDGKTLAEVEKNKNI